MMKNKEKNVEILLQINKIFEKAKSDIVINSCNIFIICENDIQVKYYIAKLIFELKHIENNIYISKDSNSYWSILCLKEYYIHCIIDIYAQIFELNHFS